jgi:hypothetical protein
LKIPDLAFGCIVYTSALRQWLPEPYRALWFGSMQIPCLVTEGPGLAV